MRWSKNKIEIMKFLSKNYQDLFMLDSSAIQNFAHKVILPKETLLRYLRELVKNGYLKRIKNHLGTANYHITQKWVDIESEIFTGYVGRD